MKKEELKNRLANGYRVEVWLEPTKKHDKLTFKTRVTNGETFCHVNYHHVKSALTKEQVTAKETYEDAQSLQFRDLVDLNMKRNRGKLTDHEKEMLRIRRHIKNVEPLELK